MGKFVLFDAAGHKKLQLAINTPRARRGRAAEAGIPLALRGDARRTEKSDGSPSVNSEIN